MSGLKEPITSSTMKRHTFLVYQGELPAYQQAFADILETYPDKGKDFWELASVDQAKDRVLFNIRFTSYQDIFSMGMLVERYKKIKR